MYFAYAQGCEASALANGKLAISIKNQTKRAMPVVMGAAGVVLDGKLSLSFISITSVIGIKKTPPWKKLPAAISRNLHLAAAESLRKELWI